MITGMRFAKWVRSWRVRTKLAALYPVHLLENTLVTLAEILAGFALGSVLGGRQ